MSVLAWSTAPALPVWALVSATHPRWRADWRERWGMSVAPVQPGGTWIVASSVGETRAGAALALALEGPVLLTADTDTGAAVGRALWHPTARKPVDHPWTLAPLWAEARPSRVVWVEGAWWPALHWLARSNGVPTVRVNARPGRGSRARIAAGLEADLVLARDHAALQWWTANGIPAQLSGDLKADTPIGENPLVWGRPFAVAGCTHPGEEQWILDSGLEIPWLIAPRHSERIAEVARILSERRWILRSKIADGRVPHDVDVVLLDTVGELACCYAGAEVAYIGGTNRPDIGGHSPMEAWRAGVQVVTGPHTRSHEALFDAMKAIRVTGSTTLEACLRQARESGVPPVPGGVAPRVARCLEGVRGPAAPGSPRPWARPLAAGHRVGRRLWHKSWDLGLRRPRRLGVPVASVGSGNARGPGKTSTVRWLLEELGARGLLAGVATRGFGRRARGLRCSWHGATADALGDEGAVLAAEGWLVAACRDRFEAGRALEEHGVDVVVLDDGLQHRQLHRDLDLVVVDGRFRDARGELPMGEAREECVPDRAHGVVLHHGGTLQARVPVASAARLAGPWHRGETCIEAGPTGPVAAFAGLGRPADFFSGLEVDVARCRALDDHQNVGRDLARDLYTWADGLPLVCTDKDRVRLPTWLADLVWWRTVRVKVDSAPESWFRRLGVAG